MTFIKEHKVGLIIFAIAVLFFAFNIAWSGEYHHSNYYSTTNNYQNSSEGVALGIAASQHNFDTTTFNLQGSVSTGSYEGVTAFSFGLAKRYKSSLISGSVSNEGGRTGYGAGMRWNF